MNSPAWNPIRKNGRNEVLVAVIKVGQMAVWQHYFFEVWDLGTRATDSSTINFTVMLIFWKYTASIGLWNRVWCAELAAQRLVWCAGLAAQRLASARAILVTTWCFGRSRAEIYCSSMLFRLRTFRFQKNSLFLDCDLGIISPVLACTTALLLCPLETQLQATFWAYELPEISALDGSTFPQKSES